MPLSDRKRNYDIEYKREKIKRVPLDMMLDDYEKTKAAADFAGESVNGYIKKAIQMRIEKEEQQNGA